MSPRGPGAVALTRGFTSLRSHPVPSLRWGCANTIKYFCLASFSAPWCHLSDGCHLTHDYGRPVIGRDTFLALGPWQKNIGMHNASRSLQSGVSTVQPGEPAAVTSLQYLLEKHVLIIRRTPSSFCFCASTIYMYRLATAGPVVSAPRTSPRRLGVRFS